MGGSGYARGGTTRAQVDPSGGGYGGSDFDDAGYSSSSAPTTYVPDVAVDEDEFERPKPGWHAGADIGLLVLRLGLGGAFILAGLQKLFGLFGGPGINGFAGELGQSGFNQTTLLAWVTGVSELGGGALLVLGLFSQFGAAAILGVMANVLFFKITGGATFFGKGSGNYLAGQGGFELEAIYAVAAFALMFTGPGRVSIDRPTPWYRHPGAIGFISLLLAAGATAVTLFVFR
jgi:putative oxidoreductase